MSDKDNVLTSQLSGEAPSAAQAQEYYEEGKATLDKLMAVSLRRSGVCPTAPLIFWSANGIGCTETGHSGRRSAESRPRCWQSAMTALGCTVGRAICTYLCCIRTCCRLIQGLITCRGQSGTGKAATPVAQIAAGLGAGNAAPLANSLPSWPSACGLAAACDNSSCSFLRVRSDPSWCPQSRREQHSAHRLAFS